jgi:uncharacterized LabA/DUF88 family protein
MTEPAHARVAVYIDFDNIVISRYNQLHGAGRFQEDRTRNFGLSRGNVDRELRERFSAAKVDVDALFEFAGSFGTIAISRAYADWSVSSSAFYQKAFAAHAVELAQLFPTGNSLKNGADIRLAVDVIEDLFRTPDLTDVVIVGGDSDYIALAQRCRRLGRRVIGVGVTGSTSKSLTAAFDDFAFYDELPAGSREPRAHPSQHSAVEEPPLLERATPHVDELGQSRATDLLVQVLKAGHARESAEWLHSSTVKNQMLQADATFDESKLGYRSFTGFMKSRDSVAELIEDEGIRKVKLRA